MAYQIIKRVSILSIIRAEQTETTPFPESKKKLRVCFFAVIVVIEKLSSYSGKVFPGM